MYEPKTQIPHLLNAASSSVFRFSQKNILSRKQNTNTNVLLIINQRVCFEYDADTNERKFRTILFINQQNYYFTFAIRYIFSQRD